MDSIDIQRHPFQVVAMGGYSYFSSLQTAAYVGWQRHAEIVNIKTGEVYPYPCPGLEEFFPHLFGKAARKVA